MAWWNGEPSRSNEWKHAYRIAEWDMQEIVNINNWQVVISAGVTMICDPIGLRKYKVERGSAISFFARECCIGNYSNIAQVFHTNMVPKVKSREVEPWCPCCKSD